MKKIVLILSCIMCLVGCSKDLYRYYDYDNLVYAYASGEITTKDMKKMVRQYSRIVDNAKGKRKLPPPGTCCEYAYLLFKQGKVEKAKEYFDKELVFYPESRTYVMNLKKSLGL